MAIPVVTCDSDIELNYSETSQEVRLLATATGSPSSYTWQVLSVPEGSTADVGVNGDFTDGIANVQSPYFNTSAGVEGSYVIQCIATNIVGDSKPSLDKQGGQQVVVVKTKKKGMRLPGHLEYAWATPVNDFLSELEVSTSLLEATTAAMDLYVDPVAGSDTHPGTASEPFQTIAKALASVPQVIKHVITINLVSGTYNESIYEPTHRLKGGTLRLLGSPVLISGEIERTADVGLCSATTIGTAAAGWAVNSLKGKFVYIPSGIGSGQARAIVSNTADTITIKGYSFSPVPDGTSHYQVVDPGALINGVAGGENVAASCYLENMGGSQYHPVLLEWLKFTGGPVRLFGASDVNMTACTCDKGLQISHCSGYSRIGTALWYNDAGVLQIGKSGVVLNTDEYQALLINSSAAFGIVGAIISGAVSVSASVPQLHFSAIFDSTTHGVQFKYVANDPIVVGDVDFYSCTEILVQNGSQLRFQGTLNNCTGGISLSYNSFVRFISLGGANNTGPIVTLDSTSQVKFDDLNTMTATVTNGLLYRVADRPYGTSWAAIGAGKVIGLSEDRLNRLEATTAAMDLYVATTGSDSNPGTAALPFLTINKALDVVPRTINHLVTINIANGDYNESLNITRESNSGGVLVITGSLILVTGEVTRIADAVKCSGTTIGTDTAGWGVDAWQDKFVSIIGGTGSGQTKKIKSNTADTVTILGTFNPAPDGTSQYCILTPGARITGVDPVVTSSAEPIAVRVVSPVVRGDGGVAFYGVDLVNGMLNIPSPGYVQVGASCLRKGVIVYNGGRLRTGVVGYTTSTGYSSSEHGCFVDKGPYGTLNADDCGALNFRSTLFKGVLGTGQITLFNCNSLQFLRCHFSNIHLIKVYGCRSYYGSFFFSSSTIDGIDGLRFGGCQGELGTLAIINCTGSYTAIVDVYNGSNLVNACITGSTGNVGVGVRVSNSSVYASSNSTISGTLGEFQCGSRPAETWAGLTTCPASDGDNQKLVSTVPANPGPWTIALGRALNGMLGSGLVKVHDTTDGIMMTEAAPAPGAGQFSVDYATGVLTFNTVDQTHSVIIYYSPVLWQGSVVRNYTSVPV